ncbi:Pyruvate decarboxylase 1 [Ancistrocladus abbreviatus]
MLVLATLAACPSKATLGRHLAQRLVQIGVNDVFSVPGDFNLNLVGCCNERNAGYARSRGVGACVVTFTVGGLSVLNVIAGVYSENLPVICIVGVESSESGCGCGFAFSQRRFGRSGLVGML